VLALDTVSLGGTGGDFAAAGAIQSFTASNTSWTVAYPAGILANQLLILGHAVRAGSGLTMTTPTGWTLAGTTNVVISATDTFYSWIFYKLAAGTETGNVSIATTPGANPVVNRQAQIFTFSSPVTSATLDNAVTANTASGTSHAIPANTTTVTNTLRVANIRLAATTATTITSPPANMAQPGTSYNLFTRKLTSSGGSGTDTFTTSGSVPTAIVVAAFKTSSTSAPGNTRARVYVRMQEV
jgi:hypothetical protein